MTETEKKQKPQYTNLQLAGQVARDVELEAVLLKRAELEATGDINVDLTGAIPKHQFRPTYELVGMPQKLRLLLAFQFDLETQEPARTLLHLAAEYVLMYRLPEGHAYPPLALECFAELNGALNVWPYWRELVHTVAARAGLGAITLPVFRAKSRVVEPQPETNEASRS